MNHPKPKLAATAALSLHPNACGWNAVAVTARGETSGQSAATFGRAVTAAFALAAELRLDKSGLHRVPVNVALPVRCAVFERLTLPTVEEGELASMVRLQFEKCLPYAVEETAFGFQVLSQTGSQTVLFACGVHHPATAAVCAPLLARQFPARLTLWAMHVAAQAPEGAVACGLWREEQELVFGIFENRRLGYVEILVNGEPAEILSALGRALMSAEMHGAPASFSVALLDPSLESLTEPLVNFLNLPVSILAVQARDLPLQEIADLTPGPWREEQRRRERFRRLRTRIIAGALVYAAVLAATLAGLGIQKGRLETLRKEAAVLQPQVDAVIERQTRWKALAPATEKRRFALELLFQTWQCLPTPETRITRFDLARDQFMIEGETSSPQQAVAFVENLEKHPELADFRFEAGQPVILPSEHAQFRIFGKL